MIDKTPMQILTEVKETLSVPERWTKCANARDAEQIDVDPKSPEATCWCLSGAIMKAAGMADGELFVGTALQAFALLENTAHDDVFDFNDDSDTEHADIVKLIDKAMALGVEKGIF